MIVFLWTMAGLGLLAAVLLLAVWRLCRRICSASRGLAPYIGAAVLLALKLLSPL